MAYANKKSFAGDWQMIKWIAIAVAIISIAAIIAPQLSEIFSEKEIVAPAQGFAFAAIGPASTIPENAHEKVVSVGASERCAVTLDATAAGIKGLEFKEWRFEDGGYNPSPKTGFCLPSDYYKAGEEMKIKAIAIDGQGKMVEDEIKIIFR